MNSLRLYTAIASLAFCFSANADSTRVEWFNSSGTLLGDFFGNPLKAGTAADYDGSSLQLGYYTQANTANPFAGSWVPLTGLDGDMFPSSIGDKGNLPAGRFNISSSFDAGIPPNLPTSNLPLSIRFYDSSSPSGSVYYNAVSDTTGAWNWIIPTEPQAVVTLSLSTSSLIWEGGSGSARRTTINIVPEPTTTTLFLFGVTFCLRRHTLRRHERNG